MTMSLVLVGRVGVAQRGDFSGVDFRKADSIAGTCQEISVRQLYPLTMRLTNSLKTDVEKMRAIFTWICLNVENDYAFSVESRKMRLRYVDNPAALEAWQRDFSRRVFQRLVERQRTVCTGYAWLVREMAIIAGLECVIVDGYARTARSNVGGKGVLNHSWNAVKLSGRWYVCDATWASGAVDVTNHMAVHEYNDAYFLSDPMQFLRDHYPQDTAWLLTKDRLSLNEFLNRPLTYRGAYRHGVRSIYPNAMEWEVERGVPANFSIAPATGTKVGKIELIVRSGSHGRTDLTVTPEITESSPGNFDFYYAFPFSGKYNVHILIDSAFVATYVVTVKKGKMDGL